MLKLKCFKCCFDSVLVGLCLCPCKCVCVCADRKQVPSVYHSSIYSENKSQIWEESFHHLRGTKRKREREKERAERQVKEKGKERDGGERDQKREREEKWLKHQAKDDTVRVQCHQLVSYLSFMLCVSL